MSEPEQPNFALVLSGGGARGAYEAGVIYYVRTQMPREIAALPLFKVYCGTSVGAINTAFLAATADDPLYQGVQLRNLWQNLTSADIYRADVRALAGFLVKSGFLTATHLFGLSGLVHASTAAAPFQFRSVLDTTPFVFYMRRNVQWSRLHRNVDRRVIDALTISATHIVSGNLALFVEKHPDVVYRSGGHFPINTLISPKHVLASAAIPVIFPIIRINRQFFGDGGLQQNTPMSPAIHLGANRLLVVALNRRSAPAPIEGLGPDQYEPEPKISDVLGKLLNTIFLDKMDYDLSQMKRVNFLIQDIEREFGEHALDAINSQRRRMQRAHPGKEINQVRKILPFVISPSEDIGVMAYQYFGQLMRETSRLSPVQRFFVRMVESGPSGRNDLISYLMFEPEFLNALIDLGFRDAQREHERLLNFFTNRPLDTPAAAAADLAGAS